MYRDGAFWATVGIMLLGAVSIGTSSEPTTSGLPRWLDTALATLTFGLLFGALPAWVRLRVRRWRSRRQRTPEISAQQPRTEPAAAPARPPAPGGTTSASRAGAPVRQAAGDAVRSSAPAAQVSPKAQAETASERLSKACATFPHPVARAVHGLQRAHTSKDEYDAMLDAAETLALTVCVTAAALLHEHGAGERNLARLRKSYEGSGPTFGAWTNWLLHSTALLAGNPGLVPGLHEALRHGDGDAGLLAHLDALRVERNHAAHRQGPKAPEEAAVRVRDGMAHLEQALAKAEFLTRLPWVLVVSSDYRPRQATFQVAAQYAMGDNPDHDLRTYTWNVPAANDTFYVLTENGPVSLSPFVTHRYCEDCRQRESCHAVRLAKNGTAVLQSFAYGHEIEDRELGEELRALPR
ncbi:hypothetical protein [Streptomyces sp. ODS28]|uniref:hypothetical protein n=1 Tax=Streptomyces sp. ODS28 TaxID=3136688 RepID=UPI0031EC4429